MLFASQSGTHHREFNSTTLREFAPDDEIVGSIGDQGMEYVEDQKDYV